MAKMGWPDDTFEVFIFVSKAPEPEKRDAAIFVAGIVVPVKLPVNIPPVQDKNNDSVEDIDAPFLHISAQLMLFNTSKA